MKHRLFIVACLFLFVSTTARADVFFCSDFNDGNTEGWYAEAAEITISSPGPDGSFYLRCFDSPSPPTSAIYAPEDFLGDWSQSLALCFDIIIHEDGWPGESMPLSPVVYIISSTTENEELRAMLWLTAEVTDNDGPHPGWHHIHVPVHPIQSLPLPASDDGYWEIPHPVFDPVTDWNLLIQDIEAFRFHADIAGSPLQTEDFGLDNICVGLCEVTAVDTSTWSRVKSLYR